LTAQTYSVPNTVAFTY